MQPFNEDNWMDLPAEGEFSGKQFVIAPPGSHQATLVAVIDLGTHEEEFKGKKRMEHQVQLVWELANEMAEGTMNHILCAEKYNFSANPMATYRILLEEWRGKKFTEGEPMPLSKVLGQPCLVNIVHKTSKGGRTYANVKGVTKPEKTMRVPKPTRPLTARHCRSTDPLPEWIPYVMGEDPREVIDRCQENQRTHEPTPSSVEHLNPPARTMPSIGNSQPGSMQDIPF